MSEISDSLPVNTTARLEKLRALFSDPDNSIDAYVIPSEDAHQSEYVASCDMRREFISGFSGSAGAAVVTMNSANLFTDGRYFLQARKQMDSNWTLMKVGVPGVPTISKFLSELPSNSRIGIDPTLISSSEAERFMGEFKKSGNVLIPIKKNLVDSIWEDKPPTPTNPVFHLDLRYSGKSWSDKVSEVRDEIKNSNATGLLVAALDQIAWLFNLRGSDIMYNPLFFSYAFVTMDSVTLFMDKSKLTDDALNSLDGVEILPYNSVFDKLKEIVPTLEQTKSKVLVDNSVNWALVHTLGKDNIIQKMSPITVYKSIKNEVELNGMRQCHIRDGVAMVKWYTWLEHELVYNGGNLRLSECDVADKLEQFRREQKDNVGLSFDTISSVGPNAAVIHYSPTRGSDSKLDISQIYLVDSGGQYYDGTTDVTRTWHFGTPTEFERDCYTRVLKGYIALDSVVFPEGTTGYVLDPFARSSLWEAGLDYRHGTGHGVGSFLNVHEGPHGIAVRPANLETGLRAGMIVTNEPGYYEDGKFGIRIENTCEVVSVNTANNFGGTKFLQLKPLTLCPIQRKLITSTLMSAKNIEWFNAYHKRVWDTLSPHFEKDSPDPDSLLEKQFPIKTESQNGKNQIKVTTPNTRGSKRKNPLELPYQEPNKKSRNNKKNALNTAEMNFSDSSETEVKTPKIPATPKSSFSNLVLSSPLIRSSQINSAIPQSMLKEKKDQNIKPKAKSKAIPKSKPKLKSKTKKNSDPKEVPKSLSPATPERILQIHIENTNLQNKKILEKSKIDSAIKNIETLSPKLPTPEKQQEASNKKKPKRKVTKKPSARALPKRSTRSTTKESFPKINTYISNHDLDAKGDLKGLVDLYPKLDIDTINQEYPSSFVSVNIDNDVKLNDLYNIESGSLFEENSIRKISHDRFGSKMYIYNSLSIDTKFKNSQNDISNVSSLNSSANSESSLKITTNDGILFHPDINEQKTDSTEISTSGEFYFGGEESLLEMNDKSVSPKISESIIKSNFLTTRKSSRKIKSNRLNPLNLNYNKMKLMKQNTSKPIPLDNGNVHNHETQAHIANTNNELKPLNDDYSGTAPEGLINTNSSIDNISNASTSDLPCQNYNLKRVDSGLDLSQQIALEIKIPDTDLMINFDNNSSDTLPENNADFGEMKKISSPASIAEEFGLENLCNLQTEISYNMNDSSNPQQIIDQDSANIEKHIDLKVINSKTELDQLQPPDSLTSTIPAEAEINYSNLLFSPTTKSQPRIDLTQTIRRSRRAQYERQKSRDDYVELINLQKSIKKQTVNNLSYIQTNDSVPKNETNIIELCKPNDSPSILAESNPRIKNYASLPSDESDSLRDMERIISPNIIVESTNPRNSNLEPISATISLPSRSKSNESPKNVLSKLKARKRVTLKNILEVCDQTRPVDLSRDGLFSFGLIAPNIDDLELNNAKTEPSININTSDTSVQINDSKSCCSHNDIEINKSSTISGDKKSLFQKSFLYKIGEASYSEVFSSLFDVSKSNSVAINASANLKATTDKIFENGTSIFAQREATNAYPTKGLVKVAFKIIPFGTKFGKSPSGDKQPTMIDLYMEIASSYGLSWVADNERLCLLRSRNSNSFKMGIDEQSLGSNFVKVYKVCICKGKFPKILTDIWDKWKEDNSSLCYNYRPDFYTKDQLYAVLVLEYGGEPLETAKLSNWKQAQSILRQLSLSLALAEHLVKFEHRDLHWGNIMVKKCDPKISFLYRNVSYVYETDELGNKIRSNKVKFTLVRIPSYGVQCTIIDYTLSRLDLSILKGFDFNLVTGDDQSLKDLDFFRSNNIFCEQDTELNGDNVFFVDMTDPNLFTGSGDIQYDVYRDMLKLAEKNWHDFFPKTNVLLHA
ncbi:putative Xaa-Pro aminopeptidase P [Smittium culicis]|uniref:Putative Xaa-Pro aminopeptidase P n=1 Tax=Smittium culicis TaxID=133412 RepID=A0A1R1YHE7_9FUNG|nr:putative Xaa-Pro aminopeptidase P [Smittium culicis]